MHLTQYQKNKNGVGNNYEVTVVLHDSVGATLGGVDKQPAIGGQALNINSQLPAVFEVIVGSVDSDSIEFKYAGQTWYSTAGQCSVGKYNKGSRQMDCGFTC